MQMVSLALYAILSTGLARLWLTGVDYEAPLFGFISDAGFTGKSVGGLFNGCSGLVTPPKLSKWSNVCNGMFNNMFRRLLKHGDWTSYAMCL